MIALIQRVKEASVTINNNIISHIDQGLLIFLSVEQGDNQEKAKKLCERTLNYRIFSDENKKMNFSVKQSGGSILVLPQFTLAADTQKGLRPSFLKNAKPQKARELYHAFIESCHHNEINTQTGKFAADMQVSLINDGPVTFWLQI